MSGRLRGWLARLSWPWRAERGSAQGPAAAERIAAQRRLEVTRRRWPVVDASADAFGAMIDRGFRGGAP